MLHLAHPLDTSGHRVAKSLLPISFFLLLGIGLFLLLSKGANRCADPLGCIRVDPVNPLEMGILFASPGANCPDATPRIENLKALAALAQQRENLPLRIVPEESGFSLSSSQQALARLLNRPNLLGVWVQDCPFGKDAALRKLIADGGAAAWTLNPQDSESGLERDFEVLIGQINAQRRGKTARFFLGRSPFREQR